MRRGPPSWSAVAKALQPAGGGAKLLEIGGADLGEGTGEVETAVDRRLQRSTGAAVDAPLRGVALHDVGNVAIEVLGPPGEIVAISVAESVHGHGKNLTCRLAIDAHLHALRLRTRLPPLRRRARRRRAARLCRLVLRAFLATHVVATSSRRPGTTWRGSTTSAISRYAIDGVLPSRNHAGGRSESRPARPTLASSRSACLRPSVGLTRSW